MQPFFLLEPVVRWWNCPSCDVTDRTQRSDVHTQMHNCAALNGVSIPLIEVKNYDDKADGRQVVKFKEDYVGNNDPVSSVHTERGDGSNDCTVFAPTAAMKIG